MLVGWRAAGGGLGHAAQYACCATPATEFRSCGRQRVWREHGISSVRRQLFDLQQCLLVTSRAKRALSASAGPALGGAALAGT